MQKNQFHSSGYFTSSRAGHLAMQSPPRASQLQAELQREESLDVLPAREPGPTRSGLSRPISGVCGEQLKTAQRLFLPTQWPEQWELQTRLECAVGTAGQAQRAPACPQTSL